MIAVVSVVMAVLAVLLVAGAMRRAVDPMAPVGRLMATAVVAGVVTRQPLAVIVAVAVVEGVRRRRRSQAKARTAAEITQAIPEVVDLFRLAAAAGLPVSAALVAVAERAPPPLRDQMAESVRRFQRGLPLDDALRQLATGLGPRGGPLVSALRRSATTGVALAPALSDLATRERAARMANTRTAVGRLTVTMVLPLVCCVLPAAVVLAVVPVVIISLSSLGT